MKKNFLTSGPEQHITFSSLPAEQFYVFCRLPNFLSKMNLLNTNQTVCKCYQQTTLVGKEFNK